MQKLVIFSLAIWCFVATHFLEAAQHPSTEQKEKAGQQIIFYCAVVGTVAFVSGFYSARFFSLPQ